MKSVIRYLFKQISVALRKTPLRSIGMINRIHNYFYELFWDVSSVHFNNYSLEVDPRDKLIAKKMMIYGEYESYIQKIILSFAVPDSIVVDIGANIGLHSIPLAQKVGQEGRVIAFEPDPDNYKILLNNIKRNLCTNISAYMVALSDDTGKAPLFQSENNRGALSLRKENIIDSGNTVDPVIVELNVGDAYLESLENQISLIKIDVEGAEPLVFRGLRNTLKRNRKSKIIFEFFPKYIKAFGIHPLDFLGEIISEGYNLFFIDVKAQKIMPLNALEIMGISYREPNELNLLASKESI